MLVDCCINIASIKVSYPCDVMSVDYLQHKHYKHMYTDAIRKVIIRSTLHIIYS